MRPAGRSGGPTALSFARSGRRRRAVAARSEVHEDGVSAIDQVDKSANSSRPRRGLLPFRARCADDLPRCRP